jgi:hypothetical protein
MKKIILAMFIITVSSNHLLAQGCVAVRTIGGISPDLLFQNMAPGDKLIFNITNRYFEASKSYKGDQLFSDTLVSNRIYTLNLSLLRIFQNGWSLGFNLPISANSRTNGADHRTPLSYPKHTTHAFGLGDMRLTVYKWLLDPTLNKKGNIQAGLGIKFPTGDYKYQDYFYRKEDSTVLAPVDQAIQLGDGGTGITLELGAFYTFSGKINVYANGFYLVNPRDQNGVSNLKGRTPTSSQLSNNTTVMSVPDQFTVRGGANIQFQKIILNAGLRYEEVPEDDLVGDNKGFRRAASISSVETGVTYKMKSSFVFGYVGIPFHRNIILNTQNDMTPAGFADVVWNFGVQFKL